MPTDTVNQIPIHALIGNRSVMFSDLQEKFEALAEIWEGHNLGRSVIRYDHIAYLQIIGMGREVIPLLLNKLREGHGEWIYALKCISGEQAETPDMHGDADRVIRAWIEWGDNRGASHGRIQGR